MPISDIRQALKKLPYVLGRTRITNNLLDTESSSRHICIKLFFVLELLYLLRDTHSYTTSKSLSETVPFITADTIVLINYPDSYYILQQTIYRIHKLGQDSPVYITLLQTL